MNTGDKPVYSKKQFTDYGCLKINGKTTTLEGSVL
jgi:hypothetical protein